MPKTAPLLWKRETTDRTTERKTRQPAENVFSRSCEAPSDRVAGGSRKRGNRLEGFLLVGAALRLRRQVFTSSGSLPRPSAKPAHAAEPINLARRGSLENGCIAQWQPFLENCLVVFWPRPTRPHRRAKAPRGVQFSAPEGGEVLENKPATIPRKKYRIHPVASQAGSSNLPVGLVFELAWIY